MATKADVIFWRILTFFILFFRNSIIGLSLIPEFLRGNTVVLPETLTEIGNIFVAHGICNVYYLIVGLCQHLFGLFHAANKGFTILALVNLVLIAVAYALICLYKGNILTTCAAHSMWNFAQGNLFGLEVSGNESKATIIHSVYGSDLSPLLTGGSFGPEGGLCVTLVSVVTIIITIVLLKRKKAKGTSG